MTSAAVFISHAGADWPAVQVVAAHLEDAGLRPIVDRHAIQHGDTFVQFMERSLDECDYCLLVWSAAAASSVWVRSEWEAAFCRVVTESERFLVVGRLDDHPVPRLLRPRLHLELQPDPTDGLEQLVELWSEDRVAEEQSARPVRNSKLADSDEPDGEAVYVTSNLWGKTLPIKVNLAAPAAIVTQRAIAAFKLPSQIDHEGSIGLRFRYHLALGDARLDPAASLSGQGVRANALLWLETETHTFSRVEAVGGVFRGAAAAGLKEQGRRVLHDAIAAAGLDTAQPAPRRFTG